MDDNLKEVLLAVIALVSAVVTPLVVVLVNKKQMIKLETVDKKLDDNHKLMNGNLSKLLETTKELATANEKARNEAEDRKKTKH